MFGVAIVQAVLGLAIATAPSTRLMPDGAFRALALSGFFTVLWLISAMLFRAAAATDGRHVNVASTH